MPIEQPDTDTDPTPDYDADETTRTIGDWYLLRIRPYRTLENRTEGAVITFLDITGMKRAQRGLHEDDQCAEGTCE